MKNICIMLRGISYSDSYSEGWHKRTGVDYRKCIDSFYENIVNQLEGNVSIFMVTYESSLTQNIKDEYKPTYCKFKKEIITKGGCQVKGDIIREDILDMCNEVEKHENLNSMKFDDFFVIRFDSFIRDNIKEVNIENEKFNFLCKTESGNKLNEGKITVDDNFFFFPRKYFQSFKAALHNLDTTINGMHDIYESLEKEIGSENIHFMFDGEYAITHERPLLYFSREV